MGVGPGGLDGGFGGCLRGVLEAGVLVGVGEAAAEDGVGVGLGGWIEQVAAGLLCLGWVGEGGPGRLVWVCWPQNIVSVVVVSSVNVR